MWADSIPFPNNFRFCHILQVPLGLDDLGGELWRLLIGRHRQFRTGAKEKLGSCSQWRCAGTAGDKFEAGQLGLGRHITRRSTYCSDDQPDLAWPLRLIYQASHNGTRLKKSYAPVTNVQNRRLLRSIPFGSEEKQSLGSGAVGPKSPSLRVPTKSYFVFTYVEYAHTPCALGEDIRLRPLVEVEQTYKRDLRPNSSKTTDVYHVVCGVAHEIKQYQRSHL